MTHAGFIGVNIHEGIMALVDKRVGKGKKWSSRADYIEDTIRRRDEQLEQEERAYPAESK